MHIFTAKNKAKHDRTPLDIYYESLEEAYGSLPVPSDDWASIRSVLEEHFKTDYPNDSVTKTNFHLNYLEEGIRYIKDHYDEMAKVLNKEQKYG